MKHFLFNCMRVVIPVGILLALPVYVLFLGREYVSLQDASYRQKGNRDTLIGFVYRGQSFIPYKEQLVALYEPTVITLGTSRMMQIRSEFFKDNSSFVNAGGGAKNIHDVKVFLENAPKSVSLVILGLDQDFFTSKENTPSPDKEHTVTLRGLLFTNTRKIYIDWVKGKYTLRELFYAKNKNTIGIAATVEGDGFRGDGSYRYGHILKEEEMFRRERVAKEIDATMQTLETGRYSSFKSTEREEENIRMLNEILTLAKERNVYIIGVLPPFPTPLYEKMKTQEGYKEIVETLPISLQQVFRGHNFPLFDFSQVSLYGGTDSEFVDSIHVSDKAMLRMLIYIAERNKQLRAYVDTSKAKSLLDSERGDMFTF